ncbi:hypothetical protein JXA47_01575 [Candidatus Sumerlaeota bacterium]|nr:hypothetical protein [Candidatus Sumerlaeota bacterium]
MEEASPPHRLLIAAALRSEIMGLRRLSWRPLPRSQVDRWPVERWRLSRGEVAAIAAGVGEEACRDALIVCHAHLRPQAILTVGWAGATVPDLHAGDICVAESLRTSQGDAIRPHPATLALARDVAGRAAGKPWRFGVGLTSPVPLSNERSKSAAASQRGVQWVDMESAVAARLADRLAIPWLSVRAISDTLRDDLELCPRAMCNEPSAPALILRTLLSHPLRLHTALRFRRQMRLASDHLCQALATLAPRILESL